MIRPCLSCVLSIVSVAVKHLLTRSCMGIKRNIREMVERLATKRADPNSAAAREVYQDVVERVLRNCRAGSIAEPDHETRLFGGADSIGSGPGRRAVFVRR